MKYTQKEAAKASTYLGFGGYEQLKSHHSIKRSQSITCLSFQCYSIGLAWRSWRAKYMTKSAFVKILTFYSQTKYFGLQSG